MADRIDPSLTAALRLTAAGPLKVRPLAEAPRIASADLDARANARLDSFQFTSHRPASEPRTTLPTAPASSVANRMIAATVPGRVNFQADAPASNASASNALPMYRHPADRNAAATAVNAGRVLDVEG